MTSEAATSAEVRFNRQKKALAWFIATCVFANHYCRDTPGALERQLEYNLGGPLSNEQYNHLQTAFFLPDIFSPLLASLLIKTVGGADNMLVYTTIMGSAGVLLFAICVTNGSVGGVFAGRFLSGAMYEVIDMIPIVILGPLFGDGWGAMVGGVNAFLRLGSALNFIVSPLVYREAGGLSAAVYTSFGFSLIMVVFGLLARRTYGSILSDRRLLKQQQQQQQQQGMDMDQEIDGDQSSSSNHEEEEDTDTGCSFPLSKFSRVYYLYAGSGFFLYGAMVPFWFIGSKFLQLKYGFDVVWADALMMCPEGMIIVLGPLIGVWLDRMKFSKRQLLGILAVSIALLPLSYLVLVSGPESASGVVSNGDGAGNKNGAGGTYYKGVQQQPQLGGLNEGESLSSLVIRGLGSAISSSSSNDTDGDGGRDSDRRPIVPIFNVPGYVEDMHTQGQGSHYSNPLFAYAGMVLAGAAYAASNSLFWTLITAICDERYLGAQTGLIASTMNILPTAVPPLIVAINAAHNSAAAAAAGAGGAGGGDVVYEADVASSRRALVLLAVLGVMGAVCAGLAASGSGSESEEGERGTGSSSSNGGGGSAAGGGLEMTTKNSSGGGNTVYTPLADSSGHSSDPGIDYDDDYA